MNMIGFLARVALFIQSMFLINFNFSDIFTYAFVRKGGELNIRLVMCFIVRVFLGFSVLDSAVPGTINV